MFRRHIVALALVALVLPACGLVGDEGQEGAAPQPAVPAGATMVRVASSPWPTCLSPVTCTDPAARWLVWEHVLPKLVEVGADGELVPSPVLAGMPEVRVDEASGVQTITFVLAPEARWHDGRPVTSSDLTGTWLAHRSTPGAVGPYDLITDIDDRDPMVARVTLARPYADWPELFGGHGGWLLQADALGGNLDVTGRFDDELPFGAGPFELASVDDGSIVLVARPDHWATARQPAVDQVRIQRLRAGADDPAAAAGGGADVVIPTSPPEDGAGRFTLLGRPTTEVVGVFLDRRSAPLGSRAVRRAVEEALDHGGLAARLSTTGEVMPCVGPVPPRAACTSGRGDTGARPDEARALLDADRWSRVAGGVRGRPGLALLVPVSYDPALPGGQRAAEGVVTALAAVGFATLLQPTDPAIWQAGDREGSTGVGIFAADLTTVEAVASLYRCEAGALNPLGWCEPENQLLARALVAMPALSRRSSIAAELAELAGDTTSWLPVTQRTVPLLVDRDRVEAPGEVPVASGPLGALHAFARVEG